MKNARRPLRLPEDFRQTVVLMNLSPSVMVQRYINAQKFFPFFNGLELVEKIKRAERIRALMHRHRHNGRKEMGVELWNYNSRHLQSLIDLSEDQTLTDKEKDKKGAVIIKKWEKQIAPLLNYPQEILLEDGSRLLITFKYMLVDLSLGIPLRRGLTNFMSGMSIAMLHAHRYSAEQHNNKSCWAFLAMLRIHRKGIWLYSSIEQSVITEGFCAQMEELEQALMNVKSYQKRLVAFRALIKEWYDKMVAINQKKAKS